MPIDWITRKPKRIALISVVAIALATGSTFAAAQDAKAKRQAQSCERLALSFQLASVKRLSPGAVKMEIQFENGSNDPYRIGWDKHATVLVDDQGDRWPRLRVSTRLIVVPPGAKAKDSLEFSRQVGGEGAKSVSITMKLGVYPPTGIGQFGTCTFSVKDVAIES